MHHFKRSPSRIWLPSLGTLLFLVLFLSLSLSGGFLLSDADTGWHIRAGEHILTTGEVPRQDIFSFISPPPRWINHQWLSEVVMALVHRAFGLTGIVILFSLVISWSYAILFRLMKREGSNIFIAGFILVAVITSSIFHWLARPHLFSLLLFVVSYFCLEGFRRGGQRILYLLPPLMILWVNLHGGFMSGLILILIYLIDHSAKCFLSKGDDRVRHRQATQALGVTFGLCLLVSLINPYGLEMLLYPVRVISQKAVMDQMAEFQSPNFHHFLLVPFKYFLLLLIAVMGVLKRRLDLVEILLILLFANMALLSQRFVLLFCVLSAPILTRYLQWMLSQSKNRFVDSFRRKSDEIAIVEASASGSLWWVGGVLLIALGVLTHRIEHHFDETMKPVHAVRFLQTVHLEGNMFNDDEFGDYLIYSAYPQHRVFVDSRVDMYGEGHLRDYLTVIYFKPGWERVIEKYGIRWMMIRSDSILSRYLTEREDWRLIYSDRVAHIFVKSR